jgi:membrane-associated phospholipid phosphatase
MPRAASAQAALWENYQRVVEGREQGALRELNPTRGIASMPSLHVAIHALILFWMWKRETPLRAFWLIAVLLTFLGSLASGWHYALDGYAGLALAGLAWWAAQRLERDTQPVEARA